VVTDSLYVPFVFLLHCCEKVGRGGVVSASEQEVLPHEDALSITNVIEVVRFNNPTTPDTDLLVVSISFPPAR
jgi:hypothetical protein